MKSFYFLTLGLFLASCSILVGQVKPVDEKSVNSSTEKPVLEGLGWKSLDLISSSTSASDIPDAAWQSPKTGAVISLNSVCRSGRSSRGIREVTDSLLTQWDSLIIQSQKDLRFKGLPGYETTALGRYVGQERRFQTLVFKSPACIYDVVYLSPVETFDQELSAFLRFRDSLNIK
ncbi:MAG: hypothetical protein EBX52_09670 [Proteobacteria bacterium]|nr:hypothetical protein [Pseudomonadota bacterium]